MCDDKPKSTVNRPFQACSDMYAMVNHSAHIPTRFWRRKIPIYCVKILVNPTMVDERDAAREKERAKPYGVRPSVAYGRREALFSDSIINKSVTPDLYIVNKMTL